MNDEIRPSKIKPRMFIGRKKADGEVEEITTKFVVHSWGVLVKFRKVFEGPNILTAQYANGWALGWFLDMFGKELYNLHSFSITSGLDEREDDEYSQYKVIIEAEYFVTGLTKEDDVEDRAKARVEGLRTTQVRANGYTYYPRSACWDSAEIIGEIDIS